MVTVVIAAYFSLLGVLALLGLHRLHLVALALRESAAPRPVGPTLDSACPTVVVQLPLFNEALVAERLIRAAASLDWPRGQLVIQVLDDSTDETRSIVARVVRELAAGGLDIVVLRRPTREGYKAGALAWGLARTSARVVAVFDADFLPAPDFLRRTVPQLLADPRCAMVQARWGHLNRDASFLTRAQAVFLDGHFSVEHVARAASGRFFNFNGTAGIWRRAAIDEVGGWSFDTITEDLELSYRAQLAGWRFAYLDDVVAPAELPESWAAFRAQQGRWVRGSVETAKKHLPAVLRARGRPAAVRLDAAVHLTANFAYLLMAGLAVLLPATVVLRSELGWAVPGGRPLLGLLDLGTLGAGTGAMLAFYLTALRRRAGRISASQVAEVLWALCLGAGMSLSNAREVLAGLVVRRSEFVRTPKRGDAPGPLARTLYRSRSPLSAALLELCFAAYFLGAIRHAVAWGLFPALPFLALYLVGFLAVGGGELLELWRARAPARETGGLSGADLPPS